MFKEINDIPSPDEIKQQIPLSEKLKKIKQQNDLELKKIFSGESNKFILIIGPCSSDDKDAVLSYTYKLSKLYDKVKDKLFIIPRVYTNKPRTNGMGYKGMLHQPDPSQDPDIFRGLIKIRELHLKVLNDTGFTTADEMLYPENVLYLDDIISYHAVGARSVENQQHRLTASGIDAPVGMKNPTSGDLSVMFNAILAAQSYHTFLYRQKEVMTTGNSLAHAIMRGSVNKHGENIPNYHYEDLLRANELYQKFDLVNPALIVDLNHSNSNKLYKEQIRISKEILASRKNNASIKTLVKGFMIESYLEEGTQPIDGGVFGKSITDPCLGFEDTEKLVYEIAEKA